jgi:hypothetical protein
MTKSTKGPRQPTLEGIAEDKPRCRWCRRAIASTDGPGRPREFCSQACRQWDWVARQRARELKLVMTRTELDQLHDALYVLACAVQDVRRDLEDNARPTARELGEMLRWILDCAEPLDTIRLRP